MSMKTVGVLITSEEILGNKKCDCASKFLIKELNNLQFTVAKVTVIPGKESSILNELDLLIKNTDIIIAISQECASLYQAIGKMISEDLQPNEDLIRFFKLSGESYNRNDVLLPIQTKIMTGKNTFPVVYFQRIFILNERHVEDSFGKVLRDHLVQYRKPRRLQKTIQISQNGNSINDFNEFNKLSNNSVTIEFSKNDDFYVFKIASSQLSDIVEVEEKFKRKFEPYRLRFLDDSAVWGEVYSSTEAHVKNAVENIEKCFDQYSLDNTFVCFNGGKDCTVLLHLILTVIKKKFPHYTKPLHCHYVQSDKPFPEQDEFIDQIKSFYNLKISTVRSGIKDALETILKKFPNMKACFMGTRRTDPYSSDMNVFQMTDSNWPQIMRVSPLLDWHYCDIWDYLLYYKVPYCKLYDMGFTSLGNTENTLRNPSLVYYDQSEDREVYLPAYKLLKETKERNGRNTS